MKRLIAALAAFALLAAGCAKREPDNASSANPRSNIKSYAQKGRIDTLPELKIGDSPARVEAYYNTAKASSEPEPVSGGASSGADISQTQSAQSGEAQSGASSAGAQSGMQSGADESASAAPAVTRDGEGVVRLKTDTAQFFYNEDDEDAGVIMIITFEDAYLLTVGAATPEIVKAMVGTPASEGPGDADAWFFLPDKAVPENSLILEYDYGDYRAAFYFIDGLLLCVGLRDEAKWEAADPAVSSGAGSSSVSE